MLAKLAAFKINFLIVFVGAPFIIFLIKLTPLLLPPNYYFNFSKLIAGGSEPFIVDPPGITGKKLCELIREHHISENSFPHHISCAEDFERSAKKSVKPTFSREQVDEIYTLAIRTDPAARTAILEAAKRDKLEPATDDEIRRVATHDKSVSAIFESIYEHYSKQTSSLVERAGLSDSLSRLYASKPDRPDEDETDHDAGLSPPDLSEETITRAIRANRELSSELKNEFFVQKLTPIKKSSVDDILATVESANNLAYAVLGYYENSMETGLRDKIAQAFARQELPVGGKERDRQIVYAEINKFSHVNYAVSIVIRLAPVLLFGIVVGVIAGRTELFSISIAGGLAAFLLSWPLILLWDRLVTSSWADKRTVFLVFYAVYILSFFLVARTGGLLGARSRDRIGLERLPAPVEEKVDSAIRITWREVAVNIVGAVVINSLVYAWNVILPLSAPTSW